MKLEVNIYSDSGLHLFVNNEQKKCFSDGVYVFNNLPEYTIVKIKQIEIQRKWYLFPLYILEGLFTLLLCCFSEYSVVDSLKPYLHECTFKITLQTDSKISVNSVCSNVNGEQGNLEVIGKNIYNIEHDVKFNNSSFTSVLVKTYFTCLSGPLLIFIIFLSLLLATSFTSVVGMVVIVLVSVFLLVISWIKINRETRKLQEIKECLFNKKKD